MTHEESLQRLAAILQAGNSYAALELFKAALRAVEAETARKCDEIAYGLTPTGTVIGPLYTAGMSAVVSLTRERIRAAFPDAFKEVKHGDKF